MFFKRQRLRILLFSILLGGLIGSFPLLTGPVSVPATQFVNAMALEKTVVEIDVDKRKVQLDGIDNGEAVMMVNNFTYIPVRFLERLGGDVRWDEQARKVFVEMEK